MPLFIILNIILAAKHTDSVDTGIIGPVTVMKSFAAQFGQLPPAVHGIIVSSTLLSAAVSSFFAGRPADTLGRPRALAFGAAVFAVGAALQAGAASIAMFAVGRAIEGLGYGLYFGTQTVYGAHSRSQMHDGAMRCHSEADSWLLQLHLRDISAKSARPSHRRTAVHDLSWPSCRLFYLLWNYQYG